MDKKKCVETCGGATGGCALWIIGWLFTIGFLKLTFWNGVLAIIVWPYFLGAELSMLGQG